jgi:hypothetical protein
VTVTRIRSQIHVAITWSNGLGITLDAVFNPARPARKFSALPGEPRLVAIKFTLVTSCKRPAPLARNSSCTLGGP